MTDSLKIWLRLAFAAIAVAGLFLLSTSIDTGENEDDGRTVASTTIAGCEPGSVAAGAGAIGWQNESIAAGPVGIVKHPLTAMQELSNGTLATKMPVLIEGQDKVTIAAASGMDGRVRLFYGPDAREFSSEGFERVRFHPCDDRERTVWPGGITVEGTDRVRLKITIAKEKPFVIGLGMPETAETPK